MNQVKSERFRSLTPIISPIKERSLSPLSIVEDDQNEISKQLVFIHSQYDKLKNSNEKKKKIIKKLKKEIHLLQKAFNTLSSDKSSLDVHINKLKNQLENIVSKRKEEENIAKSYQFLLDRLKINKISLDLELQKEEKCLKRKKTFLSQEERKNTKIKELSYRERLEIEELKRQVQEEKKNNEKTLTIIQKNVEKKIHRVEKLEEINEKLEKSQENDRVVKIENIDYRKSILMHQMWYIYLEKKHENLKKNGKKIENLFLKIQLETGLKNEYEILIRFLTKEGAYKDLISGVKRAETELEDLKIELNAANARFTSLKNRKNPENLENIEEKIGANQEIKINYREMAQKYQNLIKNIKFWAKRIFLMIDSDYFDEKIVEMFRHLMIENEKFMERLKIKASTNIHQFEEIFYMPRQKLVNSQHYKDYNNCRVNFERKIQEE